jgi:hypothetical protein
MQSKQNGAEGFGTLLARGFKIYKNALGTSFPVQLLCVALPGAVTMAVLYYGMMAVAHPFFVFMQSLFEALITYGFDGPAIDRALRPAFDALDRFGLPDFEQMMGWVVGSGFLLSLLSGGCAIFLAPLGNGAVAEAQSRAWHGVRVPFSRAFGAVKGRYGKLVVLGLVNMLGGVVMSAVFSLVVFAGMMLPIVGALLAPVAMVVNLAVGASVEGILSLSYLEAVNEDKWHFDALIHAVKRYFTHYAYVCTALIYMLLYGFCTLLVAFLDLFLALVLMFPPVLTPLLSALALPLGMAMMVSVYYAQRKKEGYAPDCAIE